MTDINRRNLLTGTTALAGVAAFAVSAEAKVSAGRDPFNYEVTRTEAEWRAMLGEDFAILREGTTEKPFSSPLWADARQGTYACRGCDLLQYNSSTKVPLLKGWVFFKGSEPNAQLMSQDQIPAAMSETPSDAGFGIEVHCRRCGSHMGHILLVSGDLLHCINGAALAFTETAT